jgi:Na+(H+)/acetate symporter ActP
MTKNSSQPVSADASLCDGGSTPEIYDGKINAWAVKGLGAGIALGLLLWAILLRASPDAGAPLVILFIACYGGIGRALTVAFGLILAHDEYLSSDIGQKRLKNFGADKTPRTARFITGVMAAVMLGVLVVLTLGVVST